MGNKKNMKRKTKKKNRNLRSPEALSAILRNSAGPMKDKRKKRQGSKKEQKKASIQDGW